MFGFLKVFLEGILYIILLPVIVLLLALYAVYCLVMFIYIGVRSLIVFFMGGTPLGDLPEDVEAKRILLERSKEKENMNQAFTNMMQTQAQLLQQANMNLYQQQQYNQPMPQPQYGQPVQPQYGQPIQNNQPAYPQEQQEENNQIDEPILDTEENDIVAGEGDNND